MPRQWRCQNTGEGEKEIIVQATALMHQNVVILKYAHTDKMLCIVDHVAKDV